MLNFLSRTRRNEGNIHERVLLRNSVSHTVKLNRNNTREFYSRESKKNEVGGVIK